MVRRIRDTWIDLHLLNNKTLVCALHLLKDSPYKDDGFTQLRKIVTRGQVEKTNSE